MPDQPPTAYGKTALIDDLTASTSGVTRTQIETVITGALDTIERQVAAGKRVTLPGFGSWQPSQRAARTGMNVRTKEKIQIPAQTGVRFTAGSTFKNRVAGRSGGSAARATKAKGPGQLARRVGEKVQRGRPK